MIAFSFILYYLITSTIFTIGIIISDIMIFGHYLKKRTLGTLLLLMTYNGMALGEICNTIGIWLFYFGPEESIIGGYFQISFSFSYGIAISHKNGHYPT